MFTNSAKASHTSSNHTDTFFKPRVQPKLAVGEPGDRYEVEADRTADTVVSRLAAPALAEPPAQTFLQPRPVIQRKQDTDSKQTDAAPEEKEEAGNEEQSVTEAITPLMSAPDSPPDEEVSADQAGQANEGQDQPLEASGEGETVQKKESTEKNIRQKAGDGIQTVQRSGDDAASDISGELNTSKGKGSAMDGATQSAMESGFSADFSNVRIHTDTQAVQMNKELGAQAFTNGSDIYFNEGKYNPSDRSGQHLLAHELTHTVQQGASGSAIQKKTEEENTEGEAQPINIDPKELKAFVGDKKREQGLAKDQRNVEEMEPANDNEAKKEQVKEEGDQNVEKDKKEKEKTQKKVKAKPKGKQAEKDKKAGKKKSAKREEPQKPVPQSQLQQLTDEIIFGFEDEAPPIASLVGPEEKEETTASQPDQQPAIQMQGEEDPQTQLQKRQAAQQAAIGTIDDQRSASKLEMDDATRKWEQHFTLRGSKLNLDNDKKTDQQILATRNRFKTEQWGLRERIAQSRNTINLAFREQALQTIQQGLEQYRLVGERFDRQRSDIDVSVNDHLILANTYYEKSAAAVFNAITSRSDKARKKGEVKAASYPKTERGNEQRKAVIPVAEEAATEIEGSYEDTLEIVTDAFAEIPQQLIDVGTQYKEGATNGKTETLQSIKEQIGKAVKELAKRTREANKKLTEQHKKISGDLRKKESDSIKSLQENKKSARKQIDYATAGAIASLRSFRMRTAGSIDATANDAIQLLSQPDKLDEKRTKAYAKEVAVSLKKRSEGFIEAMNEDGTGSDKEVDTVNINIQQGRSTLVTKIDAAILDFNTKRDTALVDFETKFAAMLPLVHTALIDSLTDISTKVDAQLTSIVTDMGTEMVKILDGVEQEVLGKIEEAMEPHDEVLAELNGDMNEAAEDAAWAYDHPVLSAIGDVLSFIGMLVLGIIAALALIFIFFYAIAAAIALLVYFGCTLLVAQIIVYGGLLTLLIINSVSAYNQRIAAGQEGGFWTGVKSVFDVVGITDIYRAFTDENMSAAERGWAIGFNGTNLIAIFRGGKINKTITKTMPTRLTNPTRGGFWTLLKNKFGVKSPVSGPTTGGATPVVGLRPTNFNIKTLSEVPELLNLWNRTLKKLVNSKRNNIYKEYLNNLENGTEMSNDYLSRVFGYVRSEFKNMAAKDGINIDGEIHHWNFPKHMYPHQITNARNLTQPIERALHEAIHRATSSGDNIFSDPISIEHIIEADYTIIRFE